MKPLYFYLFALICLPIIAVGQDYIHKKDGKVLEVTVLEIKNDQLFFQGFEHEDGPTYVVPMEKVEKIVYAKQKVTYDEGQYTPTKGEITFIEDKKLALKVDLQGALLGGITRINTEINMAKRTSMAIGFGIIGMGLNNEFDANGYFMDLGVRFYNMPNSIKKDYISVFSGPYLMPEFILGEIEYTPKGIDKRNSTNMAAILLNYGYQWVMNENVFIDLNFGIGYSSVGGPQGNLYAYGQLGSVAVKSALGIGLLF